MRGKYEGDSEWGGEGVSIPVQQETLLTSSQLTTWS